MTKWLKRIAEIQAQIPKDFKTTRSKGQVEKGDVKIGILSPDLIDFLKIPDWLIDNVVKKMDEHHSKCQHNDTCQEFHRQIIADASEINSIKEIFWASVKHELNISPYDYPNIGLRDEGIVVSLPKKIDDNVSGIIEISLNLDDLLRRAM